ncbi:MAG: DUF1622 domain-containing protein [Clostridia bacterium]|nr:DUF1622 domain-containing protein [Clostridia bacterium]
MDSIYKTVEGVFDMIIQYAILIIELIGVCVLIWAIAKAVIGLFKKKPRLRLDLAEGIALALEFKIGGELLRTVIVRDWEELLILGAVILLRAALSFLIQWEIKTEKKNSLAESTKGDSAKEENKK